MGSGKAPLRFTWGLLTVMYDDNSDVIGNQVTESYEDPVTPVVEPGEAQPDPSELELVKRIQKEIKADKLFHEKSFAQMRRDMFVARTGRIPEYPVEHYKANLTGRHVKAKTAALYAKNPKAVAKRRETLDFTLWDESPKSLMMAMQTVQMAQQLLAAPAGVDPATGQPIPGAAPAVPPEIEQAVASANALLQDFTQGMERRNQIDKIGKTLEILFAQSMREQKPVDFKTSMKQAVRRTCTTGVGYIELGFQREYGPRPEMTEKLADARTRLDHLRVLAEKVEDTENPIQPDDPEIAELKMSIEALQNEQEIVLREGLIADFPQSTKVIPDRLCKQLVGFIGSRRLTLEYTYTADQVKEVFKVDLKKNYTGYSPNAKGEADNSPNVVPDDGDGETEIKPAGKGEGLVCVWKHYDKTSGLVYFVVDGYDRFLRPPAAPDVFVEDFWPVYALTFNAVEDEDTLFPPSDVYLMLDQQMEYNRSRQGMREHRKAARPRWAFVNGALEEQDVKNLVLAEPFSVTGLNMDPSMKIGDILQVIPVPGVDPNLYETGQLFTDIQMVVGSSEAQFGGTAQATATESAIAANSSASSDSASVDDLDAFLTVVARAAGQILLREMSEEKVKEIVGVGAVWPQMTLAQIASEIFLEVEAGSSGKPNQAIEVQNFKELAPLLMQIPEIDSTWMAKEAIRRLDDRIDLTQAIASGAPSIMAQNRMQQIAPADPNADPTAQGGEGANNGPAGPPVQQPGSEPAFGSNQV